MHFPDLFLPVIAAVVGTWLALWLHLRFWERRLGVNVRYELEERLLTPDGSRIELRRLPAPAKPDGLPPVLIVHGLGANHRNNDLSDDLSLARHLSASGRDVWLLTLRSGVPMRSFLDAWRVRFRAMVHHYVPMAVSEVLARTGASQLDYVGFSMGGMLLYASLAHTVGVEHVRRVGIVGSPAIVRPPIGLPVPALLAKIPAWLFPTLRLRLAARLGAFAAEWFRTPAHHWVYNPHNVAAGVGRTALVNVIEDIPGPLNRDFTAWAAGPGGALTLDGERVLDRLHDVTVPAIFFAGVADRLAPPASVRAAYDAWGLGASPDKSLVLLGSEHGSRADYGHGDLAVGRHAAEDVFEPLRVFLAAG